MQTASFDTGRNRDVSKPLGWVGSLSKLVLMCGFTGRLLQLGIRPADAQALMSFAIAPEVSKADVLPAVSVAPTRVFELTGVLRRHLLT